MWICVHVKARGQCLVSSLITVYLVCLYISVCLTIYLPIYLRQNPSLNLKTLIWPDWLDWAVGIHLSQPLYHLSLGLQMSVSMLGRIFFSSLSLTWVSMIQSSHLHSKHLINWASSPAFFFSFLRCQESSASNHIITFTSHLPSSFSPVQIVFCYLSTPVLLILTSTWLCMFCVSHGILVCYSPLKPFSKHFTQKSFFMIIWLKVIYPIGHGICFLILYSSCGFYAAVICVYCCWYLSP